MKNLLNLGKGLNKAEQKTILGGGLIHVPEEGQECIEGMCANMPNPDYDLGPTGHNPGNPAFVQGVCRNGECFYA
ncbi:hypothetical protein [uncultured Psychroserpens sp.]|uniref:hypothetical protein n=1 Tax=uncultured Psychroserpens sp. TaxID=255436 RepID=UPI00261F7221|nr:hypothetical protein [uncultured Psychroserpens sp.]